MELFRHFPCDVLVENSQDFFYQYFKPNVVILTNSVESDYLVIIRSVSPQEEMIQHSHNAILVSFYSNCVIIITMFIITLLLRNWIKDACLKWRFTWR